MGKAYLQCISCGKTYHPSKDVLTCPSHSQYFGYLAIMYQYHTIAQFPSHGKGWSRYLPLLPINEFKISFHEEETPLIKLEKFGLKNGIAQLYCKDESKNPTGSFKDKESSIAINKSVEWGIKDIFVVSSGNAAVSTAVYAQKAEIACECLVPTHLSVGKRFLINLYGGKLKEFSGTYEDIYRMAIDTHHVGWNVTPGINPFKDEGVKIIGFEIWEEIGAPDLVIVPCGNGTLLAGLYKAFYELRLLKKIDKLPRFIGVQIQGAAPLKQALEERRDWVSLGHDIDSIAEGIIARESYASPKVMSVLRYTGGDIVEVNDEEVKLAMQEIIADEGLLPEPTAAAVFAGVKKIDSHGGVTVCIMTAGGQKNLKEIMETYISK